MSLLSKVFDKTFSGLQRSMDLTWRRNEAIVSNIANAETPGFRAAEVNFAGELDKAFGRSEDKMMKTNARHMDVASNSSAHLVPDLTGATKADGNNVDIDIQMGQLTHNSGQYSIAADLYRKRLTLLKTAIREGAR